MHSRSQAPLTARLQHALGLFYRKRSAVAKHVAKLGQLSLGDLRQKIFLQQLNVLSCSARLLAKLSGTTCAPRNVEAISNGCSAASSLCNFKIFNSLATSSPYPLFASIVVVP